MWLSTLKMPGNTCKVSIIPPIRGQLISTAEDNGAPEELLDMIGTLDRPEFNEEEDVIAELRAAPGAG